MTVYYQLIQSLIKPLVWGLHFQMKTDNCVIFLADFVDRSANANCFVFSVSTYRLGSLLSFQIWQVAESTERKERPLIHLRVVHWLRRWWFYRLRLRNWQEKLLAVGGLIQAVIRFSELCCLVQDACRLAKCSRCVCTPNLQLWICSWQTKTILGKEKYYATGFQNAFKHSCETVFFLVFFFTTSK